MAFAMDYSKATEGGVADGTYETVIKSAQFKLTNSEKQYINFDLVIRNDIDQHYKNMHVFQKVWPKKGTRDYSMGYLFMIGMNAGIPNKKEFASIDDMLADFVGKPVKVSVKNEDSEYNGKTYTNLNIKKWAKSEFPDVQHKWKAENEGSGDDTQMADPFAESSKSVNISDDDLPF